ncbi:hypothetical protein [[Limnothrix rosea] IAM M-220]|nr:hypothetical protein [[Limnothrix rosea] IAM M-220]
MGFDRFTGKVVYTSLASFFNLFTHCVSTQGNNVGAIANSTLVI